MEVSKSKRGRTHSMAGREANTIQHWESYVYCSATVLKTPFRKTGVQPDYELRQVYPSGNTPWDRDHNQDLS